MNAVLCKAIELMERLAISSHTTMDGLPSDWL